MQCSANTVPRTPHPIYQVVTHRGKGFLRVEGEQRSLRVPMEGWVRVGSWFLQLLEMKVGWIRQILRRGQALPEAEETIIIY